MHKRRLQTDGGNGSGGDVRGRLLPLSPKNAQDFKAILYTLPYQYVFAYHCHTFFTDFVTNFVNEQYCIHVFLGDVTQNCYFCDKIQEKYE